MYVTKRGKRDDISFCYFIVIESGPQMSDREVNCSSKAITDFKGGWDERLGLNPLKKGLESLMVHCEFLGWQQTKKPQNNVKS